MAPPCPRCGYENAPDAARCHLCDAVLGAGGPAGEPTSVPVSPVAPGVVPPPPRPARPAAPPPAPYGRHGLRRGPAIPLGWKYLVLGLVLALAFTLTPALRFMGWLVGSLFHETGHVAFAWYVGCPAFPAISLAGHAAAFHKPQSATIILLIGLALVAGVVLAWRTDRFKGLTVGLLVAWPLFTFVSTARELGFLLSGHLGELLFAGIFLYRARTGEAVKREAERPLYACLGWFLVARNVVLTFGLTFTESARAWYQVSGSFGLMNDYARVAYDVLHVPLEVVSVFMLLVSLGTFPLVLAFTWSPPRQPMPPPRTRGDEVLPTSAHLEAVAREASRPPPLPPPEKRVLKTSRARSPNL